MKIILLSKVMPGNFMRGWYERRSPYKDRADFAFIAVWDLENIMTLAFSGLSFIVHLAHHLAFVKVPLQIFKMCEVKCGIFAPRAMVDQVCEGLCYQRINLTFSICLT